MEALTKAEVDAIGDAVAMVVLLLRHAADQLNDARLDEQANNWLRFVNALRTAPRDVAQRLRSTLEAEQHSEASVSAFEEAERGARWGVRTSLPHLLGYLAEALRILHGTPSLSLRVQDEVVALTSGKRTLAVIVGETVEGALHSVWVSALLGSWHVSHLVGGGIVGFIIGLCKAAFGEDHAG